MSEGKRILIVEDEPVGQVVITGMLANLGYRADMASSGIEAIKYVSENHYDVIFMDCLMPGMDGFEATGKIREIEKQEQRPSPSIIIALTAKALIGDREQCIEAGMDEYLPKPLEMNQLKKLLDSYTS
jgi:CheY-like chemotaxis protein